MLYKILSSHPSICVCHTVRVSSIMDRVWTLKCKLLSIFSWQPPRMGCRTTEQTNKQTPVSSIHSLIHPLVKISLRYRPAQTVKMVLVEFLNATTTGLSFKGSP